MSIKSKTFDTIAPNLHTSIDVDEMCNVMCKVVCTHGEVPVRGLRVGRGERLRGRAHVRHVRLRPQERLVRRLRYCKRHLQYSNIILFKYHFPLSKSTKHEFQSAYTCLLLHIVEDGLLYAGAILEALLHALLQLLRHR